MTYKGSAVRVCVFLPLLYTLVIQKSKLLDGVIPRLPSLRYCFKVPLGKNRACRVDLLDLGNSVTLEPVVNSRNRQALMLSFHVDANQTLRSLCINLFALKKIVDIVVGHA